MTSVIMAVASTFDPASGKGEVPPGLRAPDVGTAPNITGPWTITGVPAGTYVVLAAFENDGGVREVSGNGGTDLVTTTVPAGANLAAGDFKVTEAVDIVTPGASAVQVVTAATPPLSWAKDPQAANYQVRVIDALGNVVMDTTVPSSTDPESTTYSGTALVPEMFYQLRIFSIGNTGNIRAASEDLKGVFVYRP